MITVTFTVPVPDGAVTVGVAGWRRRRLEAPGSRAEVDRRGAGQVGAGDGDRVAPGR